MPVSPEAKFAKIEGALSKYANESKILRLFKMFVACLVPNGQSDISKAVTKNQSPYARNI